jgi:uncharacterized membrane protein
MQQLASLLSLLSLLSSLPALVYMAKHPHRKGEPYGREDRVVWISLFLTSGFLVASSLLMFGSPLSRLLIVVALFLAAPTVVYMAKHPPTRVEPFNKTHKLMLIPLSLGFCCMIAAGFPTLARV